MVKCDSLIYVHTVNISDIYKQSKIIKMTDMHLSCSMFVFREKHLCLIVS